MHTPAAIAPVKLLHKPFTHICSLSFIYILPSSCLNHLNIHCLLMSSFVTFSGVFLEYEFSVVNFFYKIIFLVIPNSHSSLSFCEWYSFGIFKLFLLLLLLQTRRDIAGSGVLTSCISVLKAVRSKLNICLTLSISLYIHCSELHPFTKAFHAAVTFWIHFHIMSNSQMNTWQLWLKNPSQKHPHHNVCTISTRPFCNVVQPACFLKKNNDV